MSSSSTSARAMQRIVRRTFVRVYVWGSTIHLLHVMIVQAANEWILFTIHYYFYYYGMLPNAKHHKCTTMNVLCHPAHRWLLTIVPPANYTHLHFQPFSMMTLC